MKKPFISYKYYTFFLLLISAISTIVFINYNYNYIIEEITENLFFQICLYFFGFMSLFGFFLFISDCIFKSTPLGHYIYHRRKWINSKFYKEEKLEYFYTASKHDVTFYRNLPHCEKETFWDDFFYIKGIQLKNIILNPTKHDHELLLKNTEKIKPRGKSKIENAGTYKDLVLLEEDGYSLKKQMDFYHFIIEGNYNKVKESINKKEVKIEVFSLIYAILLENIELVKLLSEDKESLKTLNNSYLIDRIFEKTKNRETLKILLKKEDYLGSEIFFKIKDKEIFYLMLQKIDYLGETGNINQMVSNGMKTHFLGMHILNNQEDKEIYYYLKNYEHVHKNHFRSEYIISLEKENKLKSFNYVVNNKKFLDGISYDSEEEKVYLQQCSIKNKLKGF